MNDADAFGAGPAQKRADPLFISDQQNFGVELSRGEQRAGDRFRRRVVPSHRVDRDPRVNLHGGPVFGSRPANPCPWSTFGLAPRRAPMILSAGYGEAL